MIFLKFHLDTLLWFCFWTPKLPIKFKKLWCVSYLIILVDLLSVVFCCPFQNILLGYVFLWYNIYLHEMKQAGGWHGKRHLLHLKLLQIQLKKSPSGLSLHPIYLVAGFHINWYLITIWIVCGFCGTIWSTMFLLVVLVIEFGIISTSYFSFYKISYELITIWSAFEFW